MYSLIRILIAILIASPIILIPVFRRTFQSRRAYFLVSACSAALVLGVFLFKWPFENQFGGFGTARQAVEYQHGKTEWLYTTESENTALVQSDKTSEMLQLKQGRYYLISPMNKTRENAYSENVSVIIRGDKRTQERFVQVTMLETERSPETIADNKGTEFKKGFTYNGLTYFSGSFLEDGQRYTLYIDGVDVGLMKLR